MFEHQKVELPEQGKHFALSDSMKNREFFEHILESKRVKIKNQNQNMDTLDSSLPSPTSMKSGKYLKSPLSNNLQSPGSTTSRKRRPLGVK